MGVRRIWRGAKPTRKNILGLLEKNDVLCLAELRGSKETPEQTLDKVSKEFIYAYSEYRENAMGVAVIIRKSILRRNTYADSFGANPDSLRKGQNVYREGRVMKQAISTKYGEVEVIVGH